MWHRVERLGEIQNCDVDLFALVSLVQKIMSGQQELGLTGVFTSKSVVQRCQDTMPVKMASDVRAHDMLKKFTCYAG